MIRQAIQEGFVQYQMQTFDQSLMQLYKEEKITLEAATQASSNPHEFMLRVKGIQASSRHHLGPLRGVRDRGRREKPEFTKI